MITIKTIPTEETYNLRKDVLRKNIDLPYKFNGDLDESTFHLGAFKENKLVGIVSFMKSSNDNIQGTQYQLRGMATLPEVRGEGFGNLLIKKGTEILQQKAIEFVWCNAREVALGFYQRNGFEIIDQSFDIERVGAHYKMVKEIN